MALAHFVCLFRPVQNTRYKYTLKYCSTISTLTTVTLVTWSLGDDAVTIIWPVLLEIILILFETQLKDKYVWCPRTNGLKLREKARDECVEQNLSKQTLWPKGQRWNGPLLLNVKEYLRINKTWCGKEVVRPDEIQQDKSQGDGFEFRDRKKTGESWLTWCSEDQMGKGLNAGLSTSEANMLTATLL